MSGNFAPAPAPENDVVTKLASGSVEEVVDRLGALIETKGMKLFLVVDHSGEARREGLELRDTKLVVFGSPVAGTPVMQAAPLAALDLPLKVLVWDDDGQTKVSYTDPRALATRHHLGDVVVAPLGGIDALTDALVTA